MNILCHTFKLKYIFLMNLQKKKNREKIEVEKMEIHTYFVLTFFYHGI